MEAVHNRLFRATGALHKAGVPYAVVGGNAVAEWVARADLAAVRNTQDVDILLRRGDLEKAKAALESIGFIFRHVRGIDMFLDGPDAKARDAVHIVFANERVFEKDILPHPDVTDSVRADRFQVLTLEALVQIKLTAFRDKDRVHLRDLIDVELIDESWTAKYPAELATRLQMLLDDPNG
nr:nucleotidyltransferase family protein [Armatimonas sp.]